MHTTGEKLRIIGRGCLLVLAILVSGCSGSDAPSVDPPVSPAAAPSEPSANPSASSDAPSVLTVAASPTLFASNDGGGAPAPYSDESMADEFALGVVRAVVERDDTRFLPIDLEHVYLGRLPTGNFLAEDKEVVRMECSLPPEVLGKRSELYQPGTRVVVYLAQDEQDRWVVNSLLPITPGQEDYWKQRLQTFADIILAPESENPEQRFRELLVSPSDGVLEPETYHALMLNPAPAAKPVVRDLWRKRVAEHPVDAKNEYEVMGTLMLTYLLRNLKDGALLDEIFQHAMHQKTGQRGYYFSELRLLAEYAEPAARDRLRANLEQFLEDNPKLETLDSVKDLELWSDVSYAQEAFKHLEQLEAQPE